ncbi:MAG TPA: vWA domain-containing protein [Polyangiales bacterium]|nr:vWA domain-containing protein [Polyangiales bacterium]
MTVSLMCVAACAPSNEPKKGGGGNASANGSVIGQAGTGSGGGNFGNGTSNDPSAGAGMGAIVQLTQDGGLVCGATSQSATQVVTEKTVEVTEDVSVAQPVALYLMVDNSGSMSEWVASAGKSRWEVVVDGITAFVNDPKSANIDVALGYFPGKGVDCDGSDYAVPTVPIGRLPMQAPAIISSLGSTNHYGGDTPTEGALRGLSKFCSDFQAAHADEKCVAVLITDGDPNGCDMNLANLEAIAADARTKNGVLTYAVGMEGASFAFLDDLAVAGGTDCSNGGAHKACDASGTQFQTSIESIRDHVVTQVTHTEVHQEVQQVPLPCTWQVPAPLAGQTLDPNKINVQLTAAAGAMPTSLGRVDSESACGSHADAWYYDDPKQPTQILACPATCDAVKAAANGRIDVLLGCQTVVLE